MGNPNEWPQTIINNNKKHEQYQPLDLILILPSRVQGGTTYSDIGRQSHDWG